ncbi:hypothetical protein PHBOTO_002947, partial [Pseudozyma hubeiensis]
MGLERLEGRTWLEREPCSRRRRLRRQAGSLVESRHAGASGITGRHAATPTVELADRLQMLLFQHQEIRIAARGSAEHQTLVGLLCCHNPCNGVLSCRPSVNRLDLRDGMHV